MALPSSYLTSFKNVGAILDSIQEARAPERFTVKFLQDLGYTGSADRLFIKVLKTLGLLTESGEPTQAYHEFLDPSQSQRVMASALRSAYADLFQINKNAQNMAPNDVRAKFKTISQGAYSDDVLGKMASTFSTLSKFADFSTTDDVNIESDPTEDTDFPTPPKSVPLASPPRSSREPRLVYEVNIHLPATRDPAVYDALFASMTKHLGLS